MAVVESQVSVSLTDLAKQHGLDADLLAVMMTSIGGNMETSPSILMAVPEGMITDKLKTAKRTDSDDPLTPIEVGML